MCFNILKTLLKLVNLEKLKKLVLISKYKIFFKRFLVRKVKRMVANLTKFLNSNNTLKMG